MKVAGKVVVVTGGAHGIGRALALRFKQEGARQVVIADLDAQAAAAVASEVGGSSWQVDVSREEQIVALIDAVEQAHGPIDLFCSNAGVGIGRGLETPNAVWQQIWDINVMAHVYAARALVPRMAARGGGYLLNTASAAGLLSQLGIVTYAVTKHAAVALAEWIAITHGQQGIKVSILCPQAVRTNMIAGHEAGVASVDGIMEPEQVAEAVIRGLEAESVLILPHAEVADYMKRKAGDHNRWIAGMQRLNSKFVG